MRSRSSVASFHFFGIYAYVRPLLGRAQEFLQVACNNNERVVTSGRRTLLCAPAASLPRPACSNYVTILETLSIELVTLQFVLHWTLFLLDWGQSLVIVARTILNFRAVSDVNKPTMNTVCSHLLTYTLLSMPEHLFLVAETYARSLTVFPSFVCLKKDLHIQSIVTCVM
jgi:hypothetical protein